MATDGKVRPLDYVTLNRMISIQIRVFRFLTGKLYRVFDESIAVISEQHQVILDDVMYIIIITLL